MRPVFWDDAARCRLKRGDQLRGEIDHAPATALRRVDEKQLFLLALLEVGNSRAAPRLADARGLDHRSAPSMAD
jgi:hypothetical protein